MYIYTFVIYIRTYICIEQERQIRIRKSHKALLKRTAVSGSNINKLRAFEACYVRIGNAFLPQT